MPTACFVTSLAPSLNRKARRHSLTDLDTWHKLLRLLISSLHFQLMTWYTDIFEVKILLFSIFKYILRENFIECVLQKTWQLVIIQKYGFSASFDNLSKVYIYFHFRNMFEVDYNWYHKITYSFFFYFRYHNDGLTTTKENSGCFCKIKARPEISANIDIAYKFHSQ